MTDLDLTERATDVGGSQPLHAYVAEPNTPGPWPGVVVVHEIFGLDDQSKAHTDRLARMGFLAVAVDLFSAGGTRKCLVSTMRAMMRGQGRAFIDIEVARKWLTGSDRCTGKVGVIGFCMGGGFALIAAGRGFAASSVNYGDVPRDVDAALDGACPIVASYGAKDRRLRSQSVRLEEALARSGIEHDFKRYPSANHAFLNQKVTGPAVLRPLLRVMGMGPDPVAAADAWRRIEEFLGAHLR